MPRRLNLEQRFTLMLTGVFLVGMVLGWAALNRALEQRAQADVTAQGLLLMQAMNSVRSYTSLHVNPLLKERLETEPAFIPESVPAFSARTVFANLRTDERYRDFVYKEATLNPTNPLDRADDFERAIVERFRNTQGLSEISDFRTLDGRQVYYVARPLAVGQASCLRCHSDPAQAPQSLIASYGTAGGFGWKQGEIVAAQIVYVPADSVFASARQALVPALAVFAAIFLLAIGVISVLLRRRVIRPVGELGAVAQQISAGHVDDHHFGGLDQTAARGDEIGHVARLFQQMAHDVAQRERKLEEQLQQLRIEIDTTRAERQVAEITETDYFRNLQVKARQMRAASQAGGSPAPPRDPAPGA